MKKHIELKKKISLKKGFTLVEVIAVLVLLGILAAVAVPQYVDMSANARARALDAGIAELNGRESLQWGNELLSAGGYDVATSDGTIATSVTTPGLGAGYALTGATAAGANLSFQGGAVVALTRTASTAVSPALWARP